MTSANFSIFLLVDKPLSELLKGIGGGKNL